jgi:hypothetical protein
MPALTLDALVEVVRNRLDFPPNEVPRLKTLVETTVHELVASVGAQVDKRHYVFTDPEAITVVLDANGVGDLGPLIISDGILLERLRFGEITHPDSSFPLKPISSTGQGALASNYSGFGFLRYWLVGTKIHTLSTDNNQTPLTGSLALAVPFANGLANLSIQLEDDLIDILVAKVKGQTMGQAVAR